MRYLGLGGLKVETATLIEIRDMLKHNEGQGSSQGREGIGSLTIWRQLHHNSFVQSLDTTQCNASMERQTPWVSGLISDTARKGGIFHEWMVIFCGDSSFSQDAE